MKTVREIIIEYLENNGFDGLVSTKNNCTCRPKAYNYICKYMEECEPREFTISKNEPLPEAEEKNKSAEKKEHFFEDVFIHKSAYVDAGAQIGRGTKIWHFTHISRGACIGRYCTIGQNVFIGNGVRIEDGAKIQNNVSIYKDTLIERNVFIGPSVVFTNIKYPRATINQKERFSSTVIMKGATIGANVTILPGLVIGAYAFVGAGSVVTEGVQQYCMVTGNPAKFKKIVGEDGRPLGGNN